VLIGVPKKPEHSWASASSEDDSLIDPGSQSPAPAPGESAGRGSATAELDRLRIEIDAVDSGMLEQLNRRAALVQRVGAVKRAQCEGVYRAARERDLVQRLVAANTGPFPDEGIAPVFREIISATYQLEGSLRVAYLGPEGTFSHLAARETFGSHVEMVGVATISEIFAALERGEVDHGLVPIENTSEGVVTQALDALLESAAPICGERLLHISLNLMSTSGRLEDVREVASHPQPLAQCRAWLDRELPGIERVETSSTAAAASRAAGRNEVAAIGSTLVAELSGLRLIRRSIEDRRDNTTRFLVLGGTPPPASGNDLTSVAFTVRKGESGALLRLLEPFAAEGVNIASIQARPLKGTPWEYVFFLDVEGHQSDPAVACACQEAARRAHSHRVLGSFPRAVPVRGGLASQEGR